MAERGSAGQRKNLVGFEVHGVGYAVDILQVREIIRPLGTLRIPGADALGGRGLVGVADHRGHVVPVIDLRARFAAQAAPDARSARPREREARWLIVAVRDHLVGLVVDRVTEVFGSSQPASRDVSHLAREDARLIQVIQAAYRHRGGLVFVLDVERLVSDSELGAGAPELGEGRDAGA